MRTEYFDYLIIGSGLSGLYSALLASRRGSVALITKTTIELSNSYWAQGGIAAALDTSDDPDYHFQDTIKAGRGLCDKEAVRILVEEGRERILELIDIGMRFDRVDGAYSLGMEGGHSKRRILHAGGTSTGKELVDFLVRKVIEENNIQILENTTALNLITSEGACSGAYLLNFTSGETFKVLSSFTFIAAGGASGIFSRTTNPLTSTGDGIVLAYDAGAELVDMEFIQFHPTSFFSETGETFLISEAVRGEGGYLRNENGHRFMKDKDDKAELAPRDVVSKAIFEEIQKSGIPYVNLDMRHLDPEFVKKRFSNIDIEARKFGLDITRDLIPVAPAAHYMMGGVKTDFDSETNVSRLFVIGESASNGVHGANRLASNSLLECVVFGYRAVEKTAALKRKKIELPGEFDYTIESGNREKYAASKKKISGMMTRNAGIAREGAPLKNLLEELGDICDSYNTNSIDYYDIKIRSLAIVSRLIAQSALIREESRGAHIRLDYPVENDSFLFHIVQQKNKEIRRKESGS